MSGSTRSLEVALKLIENGYNVEVLTATRYGQISFPDEYMGIRLKWLKLPYKNELGFLHRIFLFVMYLVVTTYFVLIKRYDIIYCSSTPLTVGIPALVGKWLRKKSFIFEVRDVWPEIPIAMGIITNKLLVLILNKFAAICYKNASSIVALSVDMKSEILENYKVNYDKIVVAENGSRQNYFTLDKSKAEAIRSEYCIQDDTKIIVYPGALGRVNDVGYIVKVGAFLDKEFAFFIIGDGVEKASLVDMSKENGTLGRNVFFMNGVPKIEIFDLIALSDCLISTVADIPKLEQNSANKFFDGLRAGKCVLINYGGWQSNFIRLNSCGLVLPRNAQDAAQYLRELYEDDEGIREMQKNAKSYSHQFELDVITARIVELVKKI